MNLHLRLKRLCAGVLIFAFLGNILVAPPAYAQPPALRADRPGGELFLPQPGTRVALSPAFNPPVLKGIKVHPDNPFRFDFILDKGDSSDSPPLVGGVRGGGNQEQLKEEAKRLIKYFLASLTVPEKDLWVNLSPYEKDRIVPQNFGLTEMGRDLLAQDYLLKQITASLIYPEDEFGKKFWKKVYEEAAKKFGTTNIPVNTFNKVWIVPEKAVVYENAQAGTAYVVESKLKVMLEEDYLAVEKNRSQSGDMLRKPEGIATCPQAGCQANQGSNARANTLGSQIIREIVIPQLTKEINENKNFAQLRQVYNSLILATWYKKKIKDSILNKVYADKNKISGLTPTRGHVAEARRDRNVSPSTLPSDAGLNVKAPEGTNDVDYIYNQYLTAFKKGVYNYIKEEQDPVTQQTIPRKYFSGGYAGAPKITMASDKQALFVINKDNSQTAIVEARLDQAMTGGLRSYQRFDLEATTAAIIEYLSDDEHKEMPTQRELSELLGPSQPTFSKHYNETLTALEARVKSWDVDPDGSEELKKKLTQALVAKRKEIAERKVPEEFNLKATTTAIIKYLRNAESEEIPSLRRLSKLLGLSYQTFANHYNEILTALDARVKNWDVNDGPEELKEKVTQALAAKKKEKAVSTDSAMINSLKNASVVETKEFLEQSFGSFKLAEKHRPGDQAMSGQNAAAVDGWSRAAAKGKNPFIIGDAIKEKIEVFEGEKKSYVSYLKARLNPYDSNAPWVEEVLASVTDLPTNVKRAMILGFGYSFQDEAGAIVNHGMRIEELVGVDFSEDVFRSGLKVNAYKRHGSPLSPKSVRFIEDFRADRTKVGFYQTSFSNMKEIADNSVGFILSRGAFGVDPLVVQNINNYIAEIVRILAVDGKAVLVTQAWNNPNFPIDAMKKRLEGQGIDVAVKPSIKSVMNPESGPFYGVLVLTKRKATADSAQLPATPKDQAMAATPQNSQIFDITIDGEPYYGRYVVDSEKKMLFIYDSSKTRISFVYSYKLENGNYAIRGISVNEEKRGQGLARRMINIFLQRDPSLVYAHPNIRNGILLKELAQNFGFKPLDHAAKPNALYLNHTVYIAKDNVELLHGVNPEIRAQYTEVENLDAVASDRRAIGLYLGQTLVRERQENPDVAMTGKVKREGGIDFKADKVNGAFAVSNSGGGIQFHIDPAMLEQLQNAPGFMPVIINVTPLKDLPAFLGMPSG